MAAKTHSQHMYPQLLPCDGSLLLLVQDSTFPLVRFTINHDHGGLSDPLGKAGRNRLLFDLLLRGTQKDRRYAFNLALETMGSSVAPSVSALLSSLRAVTLKRHLDKTWQLCYEAWQEASLPQEEFSPLKDECIHGLIAALDDDDFVADTFLRRGLYGEHDLRRCAGGETEDLQELTINDMQQAYEALHEAPVKLLAFAGDVSASQAETYAASFLKQYKKSKTVVKVKKTFLPPLSPKNNCIWLIDKPDRSQVQCRLATLSLDGNHPDIDSFWLGITAFGGTFTSPLTREVRDKRGWSYFAHADFRRRSHYAAPLVLRTAPSLEDAVPCLALQWSLIEQLCQGELSMDAIVLAQKYLLNRYPFSIATAFDMMPIAIADVLLGQKADTLFDTPRRLEAIDLQQVSTVMAKHLQDKKWTAVLVGPKDKLLAPLEKTFPQHTIQVVHYQDPLSSLRF